jgi:hypothetical protein
MCKAGAGSALLTVLLRPKPSFSAVPQSSGVPQGNPKAWGCHPNTACINAGILLVVLLLQQRPA